MSVIIFLLKRKNIKISINTYPLEQKHIIIKKAIYSVCVCVSISDLLLGLKN